MESITAKVEILQRTRSALDVLEAENHAAFLDSLRENILSFKVRFPLLENVGKELFARIPWKYQLKIADEINALGELGSYPVVGIMLQLRLEMDFNNSMEKATDYIVEGNEWFVCDIIGERVMGFALLTQPENTLPLLKKMLKHESFWINRCVGVAGHYAIKKGLAKKYVEDYFELLLTQKNATNFHTKRGIGWAAKTAAKFYPELIRKHENEIEQAGMWFKKKVEIGLGRFSKYATKYPR